MSAFSDRSTFRLRWGEPGTYRAKVDAVLHEPHLHRVGEELRTTVSLDALDGEYDLFDRDVEEVEGVLVRTAGIDTQDPPSRAVIDRARWPSRNRSVTAGWSELKHQSDGDLRQIAGSNPPPSPENWTVTYGEIRDLCVWIFFGANVAICLWMSGVTQDVT